MQIEILNVETFSGDKDIMIITIGIQFSGGCIQLQATIVDGCGLICFPRRPKLRELTWEEQNPTDYRFKPSPSIKKLEELVKQYEEEGDGKEKV